MKEIKPEDLLQQIAVTLNHLCIIAHDNAEKHGFWESDNDGEKIALMISELIEVLEALRNGEPPERIAEEFADCIIRICDYCGKHKLDVGHALIAKHKKNVERPYKHGKAF